MVTCSGGAGFGKRHFWNRPYLLFGVPIWTVVLAPSAAGTAVSWSQAFEKPEVADRIKHIVAPANEENLDRLSAEVLHRPSAST